MADTLLVRLFFDAQEEFLAAIDHIPEPGRYGPLGSLSAPGRVVAHMAWSQDMWIQRFCAGVPLDPWTDAWETKQVQTPDMEVAPPLDEARAAFARVAERAERWVVAASQGSLLGPADLSGTSYAHVPTARAYMVARAVAHLFVHAGELSVIGAMVRAGDLGLPGALPRSSMPTDAVDWTVPIVAALLQDGYEELGRVAAVAPQPAIVGSAGRFNPVSYILAHVMYREDMQWSHLAAGHQQHPWMAELEQGHPEGAPVDWGPCVEMAAEIAHAASTWLQAVDETSGAQPMEWDGTDSQVGAQLARSVGHVFAHASEMLTISSQFGTKDLGMPGALDHVREATSGWSAT